MYEKAELQPTDRVEAVNTIVNIIENWQEEGCDYIASFSFPGIANEIYDWTKEKISERLRT